MGNFEQNIPEHIKTIETKIDEHRRELWQLDRGHDCNCEYCDRDGDDADPELEKKTNEIEQKIHEARNLIENLKRTAKENGIEL